MLGAITGDIIGSVFEFNNYKFKDFEPLFQPKCRFTDDTVCTVAIADALLNHKSPEDTLKEWGRRYWSNGGWGQKFAFWLASSDSMPYNSWGNGSAMRVSACGWLSSSYEEVIESATEVTEITHNHPEGIKGAQAVAAAIFWARSCRSKDWTKCSVMSEFDYDLSSTVDEIRVNNPHSEACQKTVPEALTCVFESVSFEDAIRNAISIGGDSDTIAAIAGSVAEAIYGIPDIIRNHSIEKLPEDMTKIVDQFYSR